MRDSYGFKRREGRLIFRRIQSSKGGVIEDVWWTTPVKRGVDEVRGNGQEDRSACNIDVEVGKVGHESRCELHGHSEESLASGSSENSSRECLLAITDDIHSSEVLM